ncbi:isotrichodermin C-15 hydroxylase [Aulographum hederae CBS 113979]|uniref:Isotrichodermin C-15 hydroxylase n=1 Tax=Aulographum hederae CBS 113979 TaxID=1176131 RepID=A0A6G1GRE3_9PEZI|nr:isotrichodermin C-15 hydroxylase [Aulographum hederae CBS 113979]
MTLFASSLDWIRGQLPLTVPALSILFSIIVLYGISKAVYNVYFHPLSQFPGPKLAAATTLYSVFEVFCGRNATWVKGLHDLYGPIVRTRPNEVSFIDEAAWKDIYNFRQNQKQMSKLQRGARKNQPFSILSAPDDVHARQRKLVSHAFSERALREQEPLIQGYVGLLMSNLRADAKADIMTNMTLAFNLTTFDIISDLSFGESFNGLATRTPHSFMITLFDALRYRSWILALIDLKIPVLSKMSVALLLPFLRGGSTLATYTAEKVRTRIDNGTDRPDFMSFVLRHNDERGMSRGEIEATFSTFMIAGSETTATSLSGCTYLLLKNPKVMKRLQEEVRRKFENDEAITLLGVDQLRYLNAVIEEALRLYPPVPIALSRRTPPEGAVICGHFVAGETRVGIPQNAAFHSALNFAQPDSFIPERWLNEDASFANDKKAVCQPFSVGPRNCVGRNLAYSELKLVLARLIFNFDLELVDEGEDWLDQKVYTLWLKKPLMVRVKERVSW